MHAASYRQHVQSFSILLLRLLCSYAKVIFEDLGAYVAKQALKVPISFLTNSHVDVSKQAL